MEYDYEQLSQMRMGVNYQFNVTMRKFTVPLRPLANSEMIAVANSALVRMKGLPESSQNSITENSIIAKETLKLASTEQPFSSEIPKLSDLLLDAMTNEELSFLYGEYVAICDKCNPSFELLPAEEVKALVEVVKKKALQTTEFSFLQLVSMVNYLMTKEEPPTVS